MVFGKMGNAFIFWCGEVNASLESTGTFLFLVRLDSWSKMKTVKILVRYGSRFQQENQKTVRPCTSSRQKFAHNGKRKRYGTDSVSNLKSLFSGMVAYCECVHSI